MKFSSALCLDPKQNRDVQRNFCRITFSYRMPEIGHFEKKRDRLESKPKEKVAFVFSKKGRMAEVRFNMDAWFVGVVSQILWELLMLCNKDTMQLEPFGEKAILPPSLFRWCCWDASRVGGLRDSWSAIPRWYTDMPNKALYTII